MKHPVRSLPQYRSTHCLNCETPLEDVDKYCHQCGQLNSKKRLALSDFFSELFANFISYDNRIWRTISGILFKPGKVTQEYCAGKRVHYANPFRFFLSVTIVFFLLGQLFLNWDDDFTEFVEGMNEGIEKGMEQAQSDANLLELVRRRDSLESQGNRIAAGVLTEVIDDIELQPDSTQAIPKYATQQQLDEKNYLYKYLAQTDDYKTHAERNPAMNINQALISLDHEVTDLNRSRYRKARRFNALEKQPYQLVEMVVPKIPLFLFFFAPAISLFLWLVYIRRDYNYMEHMVFTFHVFTFFFLSLFILLGMVSLSFGWISWEWMSLIILGVLGPFYLYKAMRNFYKQGRFKTIVKFAFLNFVFLVLFTVSASLFVVGSVFIGV
ncbi:DUF3667 domain-containing protein [Nonlabens ponticola]|uniref:DUF3667 domain-containing protein n=1 Tax=Nonlabens ponticola TaxID=2496866 RepID=A0A3S9MUD1_9FLAO|nr:DUF3667 domain-containing protein [Nonlabens ponticola]AZQ42785.1 DUF3667 domain-containing protein [Nonlabens ponticola]